MMALSRTLIMTLIGAVAFPSACVARPVTDETYSFGQGERGMWGPIDTNDLPSYLNASKVSCSEHMAEIDVVWNSESGDWAAFDKYSSQGAFFKRIIRFAQFDQIIEIIKDHPSARPRMTLGGENVEQYEYLLREIAIWTEESDLPFRLPECASKIFTTN